MQESGTRLFMHYLCAIKINKLKILTIMAHNIYNLIILDRSGSMSSIRNEAVSGVNETLGTIRAFAKKHPDSTQYVSLVAFCDCGKDYLYDNINVLQAENLSADDYSPCCCTPLYDTIGEACTRLHNIVKGDKGANVSVTIITDGYENSSREWRGPAVKSLIEMYRREGWLFAYIGADHDVEKVAMTLSINNTLKFEKSTEGTRNMFKHQNSCRTAWMEDAAECQMAPSANEGFFRKK